MSDTIGIVSGAAGRYATALFELAQERGGAGSLDTVLVDVESLKSALRVSPELLAALSDPSLTRASLGAAVAALADKMGLSPLTKNLLGVMAEKRRLGELPKTLAAFEALVAETRGESTALVTAAAPLSDEQRARLGEALKAASGGKSVHMTIDVDPELIGGVIVQMGSKMIDASIRSKLATLQTAMKEAGR